MHVSVIGAGGIGSAIAAYLARAGNKVTLVFKEKAEANAVRAEGLQVTGVQTFTAFVDVLEWPAPIPQSDLLVVAVKTYSSREALRCAANVPVGVALSAQNGLEKEEVLAEFVPKANITGSVIEVTAMKQGERCILNPSTDLSHVGELDGRDSRRTGEIASLFTEAGIPTKPSLIIRSIEWTKTCQWIAISLLSVMTGYAYPFIFTTSWLCPLFIELARECAAVASAEGARIVEAPSLFLHHLVGSSTEDATAWLQEKGRQILAEWGAEYRASMLVDVENGSRTEFDDIVGYILKKARQRRIPTPALEFAIRQVSRYVGSTLGART
jgi:2-dehydropantoate 2-reductase